VKARYLTTAQLCASASTEALAAALDAAPEGKIVEPPPRPSRHKKLRANGEVYLGPPALAAART
jgi:hypothetical protein